MSDTMNIEDYLAQGGVLTSPGQCARALSRRI